MEYSNPKDVMFDKPIEKLKQALIDPLVVKNFSK